MDITQEKTYGDTEEHFATSRRSAMLLGGVALAGFAFNRAGFAQSMVTDTDILNFALNLEFLEAQFYTLATTGKTIDVAAGISTKGGDGSAGGSVAVKAGPAVPFGDNSLKQFAAEVAMDEQNHVKFLQQQLGKSAIAQPNIDLMSSFNALAQAAGLGASFDPFADDSHFLLGAFVFEDVGVTAYQGAAGLLSSKAVLDKAAGILAVEAYHAASIRLRIFQAGSMAQIASSQAIAATRAKLDGTGSDDIGVGVKNGAATIVDADSNAMTFARTATQVLSIVYGGGSGKGAFYPNGLNGNIK